MDLIVPAAVGGITVTDYLHSPTDVSNFLLLDMSNVTLEQKKVR